MLPGSILILIVTITTSAQQIVDDLSFGHKDAISPNNRGIPGWHASSSGHNLQILSDRLILTPPVPGNTRGAVWSEKTIDTETWSAEVEFRASGQDTGSGNLQVWFAKDKTPIFLDSVYTVGNFDGLVLAIDQHGGQSGGMIRGFLNDGTQNFKSYSNLASLAFGHCDYSYRNLGRPSKLKVSSQNGLKVSIDDKECFTSEKISLPSGYYFGITASTQDQPDSFEVHKFVVSTGIPHTHENVLKGGAPPRSQPQQQQQPQLQKLDKWPGAPEALPDKIADEIKNQQEQFADLHNRLQGLTHQVANVFGEFEQLSEKLEERHQQVMGGMPSFPNQKIDAIGRRLEGVERSIENVKRDVEGKDYREHLDKLNQAIESVRGGIAEGLPENIGNSKFYSSFLFVMLSFVRSLLTDLCHCSYYRLCTAYGHVCIYHFGGAGHAGWWVYSV